MNNCNKIKTCSDLLTEFEAKKLKISGEKLQFIGMEGRDVYNITKPFEDDGEMIIAGRVESRHSEVSQIKFFKEIDGNWMEVERRIELELQDPFVTKISGEIIFGGVEVFPHPILEGYLGYRTAFYRGADINSLKKFTVGPELMKDIRLLELPHKKIIVFTRPQGNIGGRGKIAVTIINSIDELNTDVIGNAEILENQFIKAEWGGANELHLLNNGLIGVLGHVSNYDEIMDKHYYAMVFSFDFESKETSPVKLIAIRKNFQPGEYKRKDTIDVVFSGGINRLQAGMAELYASVSDAESYKILIEDPFAEYEEL